MAVRKIAKTRRSPRDAPKKANDGGLDWRLAKRGPIRAYDEFSHAEIELRLCQKDSSNIEGLLIDFRYVAADGEISRRSLLCWQCGRHAIKFMSAAIAPFGRNFAHFASIGWPTLLPF
jgi:hypothetical protein